VFKESYVQLKTRAVVCCTVGVLIVWLYKLCKND
jgi:hypothetical protein